MTLREFKAYSTVGIASYIVKMKINIMIQNSNYKAWMYVRIPGYGGVPIENSCRIDQILKEVSSKELL